MQASALFLFGYSGHSYVILDSIRCLGITVSGYFDYQKAKQNPYGLPYLGFERDADLETIIGNDFVFPAIGENRIRKKLVKLFEELKLRQLIIKDPTASVSPKAEIQSSTYLGAGAIINALASIGKAAIINTGAIVEHECVIGSCAHIGPNATLAGNVIVGDGSFVGAGAVVKQGVHIGKDCIIGAGSVVIKDVQDGQIHVGNPAKYLKHAE